MDQRRKYWSDIALAIAAIEQHLQGISSFDLYCGSLTVKDAVERRLITIGEAVSKLLQLDPDLTIEHGQQIRAFRNRLVHSYDSIDDATVWSILINHLPAFKEEDDRNSA